ncbi:MAG: iron-containing alcohol dehydrogenase [Candidatus Hodarchaeales archaeon]
MHVPRQVAFGPNAVQKIPSICNDIGATKIQIISGPSKTKELTKQYIIPQIEGILDFTHVILPEQIELGYLYSKALDITENKPYLMAVGGGKVIDHVKVIASLSKAEYVVVPTNASHDGFSSPYINFLLREDLAKKRKKLDSPVYSPISPLAIVGDTSLISQAPIESLKAGVGDILAKWVAVRDWKLAHRLKAENFDSYAATFSEMTALMVENSVKSLGKFFFSEKGIRVLMKALGSSGVAMSIAGSSRPASGSEHLVSHALDQLSYEHDLQLSHGHQVGLISILMMFLHGDDWKRIRDILIKVAAPVTLQELGIDRELLLEAIQTAHNIRPERYTILSEGLSKKAAINAIEMTGID